MIPTMKSSGPANSHVARERNRGWEERSPSPAHTPLFPRVRDTNKHWDGHLGRERTDPSFCSARYPCLAIVLCAIAYYSRALNMRIYSAPYLCQADTPEITIQYTPGGYPGYQDTIIMIRERRCYRAVTDQRRQGSKGSRNSIGRSPPPPEPCQTCRRSRLSPGPSPARMRTAGVMGIQEANVVSPTVQWQWRSAGWQPCNCLRSFLVATGTGRGNCQSSCNLASQEALGSCFRVGCYHGIIV